MADVAPINWTNAMTLISVAILVGTELVGAGAAAGWAIGGLFQLGETITRSLEARAHSHRADWALLFSARGGRARADPRLAGRALGAKIAFPDRRRGPWGCICAAANTRSIGNAGTLTAEPNRRSALLVDLDGTLTDPAEGIVGCFRLALEALGRSAPPAAELNWIIGPPLRGCFAEALNGEGDPEEALRSIAAGIRPSGLFEALVYEGVKETLTELRATGTRLFLCTAKPLVYAERILSHFDLERHFDAAYGDELGGRFQDKADLVAHILEREGLEADDCCMWGDRKHDVLAASRHGIPTIGALWGYGGADELRAAGAAALCKSPSEVPAAFGALPRAAGARAP